MSQNAPEDGTGIYLVTALGEEQLTDSERVSLLQQLRLKGIPHNCNSNKEK